MLDNAPYDNKTFTKDFCAGVLLASQSLTSRIAEIDEQIETLTQEKEGHLSLLADLENVQNKSVSNIVAAVAPVASAPKKMIQGDVAPKAGGSGEKLLPAKASEPPFIPDDRECKRLANKIAKLLEKENRPMKSAEIRSALGLPNDPAFWQPVLTAMLQHPNVTSEGEKLQKKYFFKSTAE